MANMMQPNHRPGSYGAATDAGPITMVMGFGLLFSGIAAFMVSFVLVGALVAYFVLVGWFEARAHKLGRKANLLAQLCLYGSLLIAFFGPLVVYMFHWLTFAPVAWAVVGLYIAALVTGWIVIVTGLLRLFALLAAAAMVAAMIVLPEPKDPERNDPEQKWEVVATVHDADGNPIAGAIANCASVMVWDTENPGQLQSGTGEFTDDSGHATFEFHEDTRLKAAVCLAFKPGSDDEPGYALRFGAFAGPSYGGEFPVDVKLDERSPKSDTCNVDEFTNEGTACKIQVDPGGYYSRQRR